MAALTPLLITPPTMTILPLHPHPPSSLSISLIHLSPSFLPCARSLSLSLSSNYCIISPLSILETCHSLLSISPLTLSPRHSSLSTPLRYSRSTPLRLVYSIFLHYASIGSAHHPHIFLLCSACSVLSMLISDFSAHTPLCLLRSVLIARIRSA